MKLFEVRNTAGVVVLVFSAPSKREAEKIKNDYLMAKTRLECQGSKFADWHNYFLTQVKTFHVQESGAKNGMLYTENIEEAIENKGEYTGEGNFFKNYSLTAEGVKVILLLSIVIFLWFPSPWIFISGIIVIVVAIILSTLSQI